MIVLAAKAQTDAAGGLLTYALLFGIGYVILSFFFRRIGGKGGGSDKASVGAWWLLAALCVGVLMTTR
ncbi:hypothetical protein [Pseudonocardia spinosispora]|uniref:hypothetical protein n=1 Tax=Pseudonocardia spinosispora TaxID=103441 RepID=UPI0004288467|nr:hypothetical protein [Pseudonocardia spinosispora]